MNQVSVNPGKKLSERLKILGIGFRKQIKFYRAVAKDRRTPKISKLLLGLAIAYAFLPFDIIPDFIPIIGHLDDFIILPLLIYLAVKLIPQPVLDEHREAVELLK